MVKINTLNNHALIEGDIAPNRIPKTFTVHGENVEFLSILFPYKYWELGLIAFFKGVQLFFHIDKESLWVFLGISVEIDDQLFFDIL